MNKLVFFVVAIFVSIFTFSSVADESNPHSFDPLPQCSDCHVDKPKAQAGFSSKSIVPNPALLKQDGTAMCTGCHEGKTGHMVGVTVNFSIPADFPLDEDNKVTCLTCHYTHGSLVSDNPQASYSFMDVLVNSDRLHKSFLIRRNNIDGALCLICHKIPS